MITRREVLSRAALAALLATTMGISAPTLAADATAADTGELTEVVITGSRIRRNDAETPSPVQVITREDVERSGQQNVADLIRSVSADNQGSLSNAFGIGFAAGASAVSLRGLGLNSTLVLVNGRRMAPYGLADDGARSFVDLNTIPLEAVERIDVVKDGASAIYGSDAVAGVVNIILRENYQGASLGGTLGTSYKGDGNHHGLNGSWGTGDIASDRYNVFATIETSKDNEIRATDRDDWLGTSDLRPWGSYDGRRGAYLNPNGGGSSLFADNSGPVFSATTPYGTVRVPNGTQSQRTNLTVCPQINPLTGVCLFDEVIYKQIQPQNARTNVYARGSFQFSPAALGYLELGWFNSRSDNSNTSSAVSDTGVFNPADPANPVVVHTTTLPVGHPDNPYSVARSLSLLTTMFGGRNTHEDSTVTRTIVGVKGDFSRWHYDVAAGYVDSKLKQTWYGLVSYSALTTAVNNRTFRIDPALNSSAVMSSISHPIQRDGSSSVALADGTISGDLAELPGGSLGGAAGVEYRKEKALLNPVPGTETSDIIGLGYSAYSASRSDTAAYVELNAPIVKMLEVDGAYRYDRYSDYGSSKTPKIGLKFTPIPQLSLRGTYSEAFRAPGPTESGNSSALGFTSIGIITIGDPNVKPETAKSYTLGFVVEPIERISASVDFYSIKRKDEITTADPAVVVGNLPQSGTPNSRRAGLVPNSYLYYDVNGDLASISAPYANINGTTTNGVDIDLRDVVNFASGWQLESRLLWTRIFKYERELADGTKLNYVGTHGPYSLSSGNGTPRDRASLEFTLAKDKLAVTARINYVSAIKMVDNQDEYLTLVKTVGGKNYYDLSGGESAATYVADPSIVCGTYNLDGTAPYGDCMLPSFTTLDLRGKWTFNQHAEVTLNVTNVLNKEAPLDAYLAGGYRVNYNTSFHQSGAVGRYMTLGAHYRF